MKKVPLLALAGLSLMGLMRQADARTLCTDAKSACERGEQIIRQTYPTRFNPEMAARFGYHNGCNMDRENHRKMFQHEQLCREIDGTFGYRGGRPYEDDSEEE